MTPIRESSLAAHQVHPDFEIFYISQFLSPLEQRSILGKVEAQERRWVKLKNRRLQAYPSELLRGTTLVSAPLPDFLSNIILARMASLDIFSNSPHGKPNHVLVNEYKPGQGITPHEDGEIYFPLVATISLGSHCVYNLYTKNEKREVVGKVLQEPGSLMVTRGASYSSYLHGIDEVTSDDIESAEILNWSMLAEDYQKQQLERDTRISLTYRDVLKEKSLLKLPR